MLRDALAELLEEDSQYGPVVELDDILRDALSDLLQHDSMYAPAIAGHGAVVGVLSIELLAQLTAKEPQ